MLPWPTTTDDADDDCGRVADGGGYAADDADAVRFDANAGDGDADGAAGLTAVAASAHRTRSRRRYAADGRVAAGGDAAVAAAAAQRPQSTSRLSRPVALSCSS